MMTHMEPPETMDHDSTFALDFAAQRARFLSVMAASAPVAISVPELWKMGFVNIHNHVEKLTEAGHRFTRIQVARKSGKVWAWRYDGESS